MNKPTEEVHQDFLRRIQNHEMKILKDHGTYRHIVFRQFYEWEGKRCASFEDWFELITWPGTLCINGDMGTYVFRRVDDMFTFFRRDELGVNLGYWSEKLSSTSRHGVTEYSPEKFREVVLDDVEGWEVPACDKKEVAEAVKEEVLPCAENHDGNSDIDEYIAMKAAYDFDHQTDSRSYYFQDFWEHDLREYKYHFVWNCFAIVWAIQQYDQVKSEALKEEPVAS